MSRSGYAEADEFDPLELGQWRGAVASSIRGKRGQAFLRELIAALDALPEKRLIAHDLHRSDGVCAIGSVGLQRGVDMSGMDPEQPEVIAGVFGIAGALVREIEYMNDEAYWKPETPEDRWQRMRAWAVANLAASGIETEGHDGETRHGAEHESPAPKGDAQ